MGTSTPVGDSHAERASTHDLLQLPVSPENADAKLNHLIVRMEFAVEQSLEAKNASVSAMNTCLKVGQQYEPLTKLQRFFAVASGAVTGSAITTFAIWLVALGGVAILGSCFHK